MLNGVNQHFHYTGGYSSSNPRSSLGLIYTNDGFNELSQIMIQNLCRSQFGISGRQFILRISETKITETRNS